MFRLAPIDNDFVPYSRRRIRKNNAGLFVKGRRRGGAAPPAVALQQSGLQCRYQCDSLNCPAGMVCDQRGGGCQLRYRVPECL
jgi:hypothetical protein